MVVECVDKFFHGNFNIGKFENGLSSDRANFCDGQISELTFKHWRICWGNFNEQTSIDFSEKIRSYIYFQSKTAADAHLCGGDGEAAFAEIMCRFNETLLNCFVECAINLRCLFVNIRD